MVNTQNIEDSIKKEVQKTTRNSHKRKMFSLNDTFLLLADSVSALSADEFVARCGDIGMVKKPFVDTNFDHILPFFDNGYLFMYITDDDAIAMLEVLEMGGRVLQAGIQIIYPKKPSKSNLNEHYKKIVKIAKSHYGIGQPIKVGKMEIINYGKKGTIFYILKSNVNDNDVLTFRAGNRDIWEKQMLYRKNAK